MADIKISQLPTAASPSVADILPVVSGGATDSISIQNIVDTGMAVGDKTMADGSKLEFGTGAVNYLQGTSGGVGLQLATNGVIDIVQTDPAAGGPKTIAFMDQYGSLGLGTNSPNPYVPGLTVLAMDSTLGSITEMRIGGTTYGQIAVDNTGLLALLGSSTVSLGTAGDRVFTITTAKSIGLGTDINEGAAGQMIVSAGAGQPATWSAAPAIRGGTINNTPIGAVTAAAVNATTLTASSSLVTNGASVSFKGLTGGTNLLIAGAGATGDPQLTISTNDAADLVNIVPNLVGGGNGAGLLFALGDSSISDWTMVNGDLFPSQGNATMTNGFVWIPAGNGAPTGVPTTSNPGIAALYFNETTNKLYVYNHSTLTWVSIN